MANLRGEVGGIMRNLDLLQHLKADGEEVEVWIEEGFELWLRHSERDASQLSARY